MIQYLGWMGAALFTFATLPQLRKVWREGHADGMSWGYLLPVWTGFWCMGTYTWVRHAGTALVYSYGLQLVAFSVMIVRKGFPVKGDTRGK